MDVVTQEVLFSSKGSCWIFASGLPDAGNPAVDSIAMLSVAEQSSRRSLLQIPRDLQRVPVFQTHSR